MRTLEEIADNPREATISENLVLVADPFDEFKGEFPSSLMDGIVDALIVKFSEGSTLIPRFSRDLHKMLPKTEFEHHEIENFYQKLEIVMDNRPALLEQQAKRLWNRREAIKKGRFRLNESDEAVFQIVPYTYQWRHHVEKRKGDNPFQILKRVSDTGIILYLRQNPNKGYPDYPIYGWQEKLKVRENIIKKLLYKLFKALEETKEKEAFYERSFGPDFATDYFGVKVIGTSRASISSKIGNFLHNNPDWIIIGYENYLISKGGRLRGEEYLLKHRGNIPLSTEELQLQVTSLTDFLLDDFFLQDSHPRYKLRRDAELKEYERENKRLYRRMEDSMNNALLFLPR